jgi:GNAT superfamily N-acetyltransferase
MVADGPSGIPKAVRVISYLELTDGDELRPPEAAARVEHSFRKVRDPDVNRDLYAEIGSEWGWTDRLRWPEWRWEQWSADIETWIVEVDGEAAGYAELRRDGEGSVLLAIFGLRAPYRGLGLGGAFLTHALRRALELEPRVWVSTNTGDGPHALANYEARGMRIFRQVRA